MSNWTPVTTDEGATFEPWTDGHAVGFKVSAEGMPTRYLFLNPSGAQDSADIADSDAFVYVSETPDIEDAEPQCFITVWS